MEKNMPINVLKSKLKEYEHAKEKSIKAYNYGRIDYQTHLTHLKNLNKLIKAYERAIKKIE